MKANVDEFTTKMSLGDISTTFTVAVKKRPLKLKMIPFRPFAPTKTGGPSIPGVSMQPDHEIGFEFQAPGPDPMMGTVQLAVLKVADGHRVRIRSAGNMRGRLVTNSMAKHVLAQFKERDPSIQPVSSSEAI
ncbi:MAG TPA: hypothetical protein VMR18_00910 [Candidatus Saccharimonadales bacterium]|nr:hypothetical protein [Candidatus Saccharimonadales bacterium]